MPSVNINDPFTEAGFHENRSARAPRGRGPRRPAQIRRWVLCRGPWYLLTGGLLALAAMLKG
jgi:hypothetical protein